MSGFECAPTHYINMATNPFDTINNPAHSHSLADCNQAPAKPTPLKERKKKQETTMYGDTYNDVNVDNRTEAERTRDHFSSRIHDEKYKKERELSETFAMYDMDRPTTAKELTNRISKGLFILNDQHKDTYTYDPMSYIQWRDPAKPKDEEGFRAACTKLQAAAQDAEDLLLGSPADQALKILNDFKAQTFA